LHFAKFAQKARAVTLALAIARASLKIRFFLLFFLFLFSFARVFHLSRHLPGVWAEMGTLPSACSTRVRFHLCPVILERALHQKPKWANTSLRKLSEDYPARDWGAGEDNSPGTPTSVGPGHQKKRRKYGARVVRKRRKLHAEKGGWAGACKPSSPRARSTRGKSPRGTAAGAPDSRKHNLTIAHSTSPATCQVSGQRWAPSPRLVRRGFGFISVQ